MESIRFIEWISNRKEKTTNLPRVESLDCSRITNLGINIFQVKKRNVSSLLLLFFFILLVDSFSQKFLKAFTISKQIDCAIIFKTASLAWRCHAIITVVKISSSLGIFKSPITFLSRCLRFFFTCKQPTLNFFRGQFYLLNPKECRNIVKTARQVGQNIEKKLPRRHVRASDVRQLEVDFLNTWAVILNKVLSKSSL